MDISDPSISKCFFSLSQFFAKSGLLSSRFFIPTNYAVHFQTIGMSLSLKFTNANVKSINFTSRFRILLLRVDDLLVLQGLVSQLLTDQRTRRKFHLFLELTHVLRKCLLCRKMFLDSAFFRVRTLRQLSLHFLGSETNWTLELLEKSDKLVVGQHLLLYPVSTAVKPACSVSDHRPSPIQDGESQCSQVSHTSAS